MAYSRINFKNGVEGGTPLSATNMNHLEDGIVNNEDNILSLNSTVSSIQNTISNIQGDILNKQDKLAIDTLDLTFTFLDESTETYTFIIEPSSTPTSPTDSNNESGI